MSGDGESWARQSVDFAGLPEMVRCFLQVAAGAADIPVTRLLGQSPAGLSATGDSDTRNYYDIIVARQELDLRPGLERLDRLILRSEGLDEGALTFAFRPLWQLDEPARAALSLSRAQATQVYAASGLWPAGVVARLAKAQLVADGTYPNAAAVFAEGGVGDAAGTSPTLDYDPAQPRDPDGKWTATEAGSASGAISTIFASSNEIEREQKKELEESGLSPFDMEPDMPIVKPMQGMVSHGILSQVPKPISPKPSSASIQPSASRSAIRFGTNANQTYHAYRHIDEVGIDRARVEDAVRNDLISRFENLQDGLNQGSVVVDGRRLDYNAYKLPSGEINVGRITNSR